MEAMVHKIDKSINIFGDIMFNVFFFSGTDR